VRSVGVGAGITGMGGNWILIDDPIKSREEANSDIFRERVWDWYRDDLYTRREPNAKSLLIQTRWHEDDLAGRILNSEDARNWLVINLPALAEPDDPLGRQEGEALCPARYSREDLLRIKTVLGSSFEALFQGRPTAMEGGIFKRSWWKFYRGAPRMIRVIQVWDTAFKKGKENDYSGGHTWGEAENGYFLLDRFMEKLTYPELKRKVKTWYEKWRPNAVLVEDKASGQSLIQDLQLDSAIPILPMPADNDKEARAHSVTPFPEAGKCFLPEEEPWTDVFIDQMANFPNAAHDEDVDCFAHGIGFLSRVAGRAFDGCLG
jgi:predicted phage terminase large subunit-like protein